MSPERDTHFIGFAYRVLEAMMDGLPYIDVYDSDKEKKAVYAQFIAQCAYDLVGHTIDCTEHINLDRDSTEEHILKIPDLPDASHDAHCNCAQCALPGRNSPGIIYSKDGIWLGDE